MTFLGQSHYASLPVGPARRLEQGVGRRAYPVPVPVTDYAGPLSVIATEEHEDHLGPLTLAPLLAASPQAVLLIPSAARSKICWLLPSAQLKTMRGELEGFQLGPFNGTFLPAAHSNDCTIEITPSTAPAGAK